MSDFEEWVPLEDFELYLISSRGNVRHVERNVSRSISLNAKGFPVLILYKEGSLTRYLRQLNVLVAKAFLPEPEDASFNSVWHIDGDLTNCHVSNLYWSNRSKVLEWNEMHRSGEPKFTTPQVKHTKTGKVYANAYECAMAMGELESYIVWKIERQAWDMFSNENEFRYVTETSPA